MPPPPKTDPAAKADARAEAKPEIVSLAAAPAARRGFAAWLPAIASLLLAPVATWAAVEFVVLPRLQKKIAAMPLVTAAVPVGEVAAPGEQPKRDKDGKEIPAANYQFDNIVVNLAGTMGTRYLKTSFLVTGADPNIKTIFNEAKPRLLDITNNVLSSLTLADLEEPGSRNVIREKLVGAYNQALGKKVADQVYFSDFVIQ